MTTRIVGLGQAFAGDDGVAYAVMDALAHKALPEGVELTRAREASALIELLDGASRVVVIDAVVGAGAPGQVRVLDSDDLDEAAMSSVSSHGIGVAQAIELARALSPETTRDVFFVAVSIDAPSSYGQGLSPEVASAVPRAVLAVVSLLERTNEPCTSLR